MIEYRRFRIDTRSRHLPDLVGWAPRAVVYSTAEDTDTAHPIDSTKLYPTEEQANAMAIEMAKEPQKFNIPSLVFN